MDNDFEGFLRECNNCRTKFDFLRRISAEKKLISQINDPYFIEQQQYLRRLDNAKFCAEHGTAKEEDTFNNLLYELLDRLK
jgi:hypothetical protein